MQKLSFRKFFHKIKKKKIMKHFEDIKKNASQFVIYGDLVNIELFGKTKENNIYLLTYNQAGTTVRYIIKRLNNKLYEQPIQAVSNAVKAAKYILTALKTNNCTEPSREVLTFLYSQIGKPYICDDNGNYWMTCLYIENTTIYEKFETPELAKEAAKTYARFHSLLADIPSKSFQTTIKDHYNIEALFNIYEEALKNDFQNRKNTISEVVTFLNNNKAIPNTVCNLLQNGEIQPHAILNNVKPSRLLFDSTTKKGIAIFDLDSAMCGNYLFHLGEVVRNFMLSTNIFQKENNDTSKFLLFFEAIVKGYFEAGKSFLSTKEIDNLVNGAEFVVFFKLMLFVTNFLNNNTSTQNFSEEKAIESCNEQLHFLKILQSNSLQLNEIVKNAE